MKTTKFIGDLGERVAVKLLKKKKYKILERNLHEGKCELDIIAANREFLVFAEVKTRSVESLGDIQFMHRAADAVDKDKRSRTILAARRYLSKNPTDKQPRFDVIEVYLQKGNEKKLLEINHIENAF